MADPLADWVRDVLVWVRSEEGDIAMAAEALLTRLRGEVTPTTPDTGSTLLGAVERRFLHRLP